MKILTIIIIITIGINNASAKKNEKYYQKIHCDSMSGKIEHRLKDRTRVDCLTKNYAIEHDWASGKVYECLMQALYYAMESNRKPMCALILRKEKDIKYVNRAIKIRDFYDLPIIIETIIGYE